MFQDAVNQVLQRISILDNIKELKRARVMPFTQAPYFQEMFEATIETMKRTLADDQSRYSQDWASTGLSGLANGTIRKASRIFDLVVMEMPGKDKPEEEFIENLMSAFYAYAYYKMLTTPEDELVSGKVEDNGTL